jgi:hypothetical protein
MPWLVVMHLPYASKIKKRTLLNINCNVIQINLFKIGPFNG